MNIGEILIKMGKLDEYNIPFKGEYTLFILPDGRMIGENKLVKHKGILEKIINKKINSNQELVDLYIKLKTVKIKINKFKMLYININVPCTTKQKLTLKN